MNWLLREALGATGSRDAEQTRERLDVAKEALGNAVDGSIDLLFGGSVAKHTYVEGLSDVDALVLVNLESLGGDSPSSVLASFAEALRLTHESIGVEVSSGRLAVTLRYPDGAEIQLVPAIRIGDRIAISNPRGTEWSNIRPDRFASKLTAVNAAQSGQVVPTIKLAKQLVAQLPENRQLSGYHIESLAIEAFEHYDGGRSLKEMLTHFFESSPTRVLTPIRDSSGQSVHVDGELGQANSLDRQLAADALGRLGRKLKYATSIAQWRAILRR